MYSFRRHYKDLFYALYFLFSLNQIIQYPVSNSSHVYYFSLAYARALAGKLNLDLQANLNGHPSMCHSIQIWIRLKKLYFHGKWQNHVIWMINWIYITIFSETFQYQCKEQTNKKLPLTFSHYTRPHLKYGC